MDNIIFTIIALFYNILLIWIRYSKETEDDVENVIYRRALAINNIALITELAYLYLDLNNFNPYSLAFKTVTKILMVCIFLWVTYLTYYIYIISKRSKKEFHNYELLNNKFFNIFTIINIIVIILLPYQVNNPGGIYLFQGNQATFLSVYVSVHIISVCYLIIRYRKKMSKEKLFSAIFELIGTILLISFQLFHHALLFNGFATVLLFIFYLTSEKPEIQLVEQYNIAKLQADKANNAKSDFLSSMSHEIRTPLNAIVSFSSQLNHSLEYEELKDISKSSKSLLEIINNILDISKIEAGRFEIVKKQYSIDDLIFELNRYIEENNYKGIEIIIKQDSNLPKYLSGDKERIKHIINNLLSNSLKYTDNGYIKLEFSSLFINDNFNLKINVIDTGIGIEEAEIEKIFNKFEKLNNKFSSIHGTGLGLPLVKEIIKLMNGKINISSEPGKGSNFEIIIPQKIIPIEEAIIEAKLETSIVKENVHNKKILAVDDNLINLKVITNILKEYDVQITQVDNGQKAIDVCKNEKYDLIFLDIMMPEKDGEHTLLELKEIDNFNTPVIALTANEESNIREKYIKLGFNDYLSKPIIKNEINRIIYTYLSKGDMK